jgi:hypothetical protein
MKSEEEKEKGEKREKLVEETRKEDPNFKSVQ